MRVACSILGLYFASSIGTGSASAAPALSADAHRSGVLVAVTTGTTSVDSRPRTFVGALVERGLESFVAHEMASPPSDAAARVERGTRALGEARRFRRMRDFGRAAAAAAQAVGLLSPAASERAHLELLVEALIERGANAAILEDAATAETVFLEALALAPRFEPSPELYPQDVRRLFSEVRRASRQLRFATVTVEVPTRPNATISIDFGRARPNPYTTKLAEGRHYISVDAEGREPVTVPVNLRAERRHRVELYPPSAGDKALRQAAVRALDTRKPETIVDLAQSAGLRYVLASSLTSQQVSLQLFDGRTGQPVSGGETILSVQPAKQQVALGVDQLMQAMIEHDPDALDQGGGWYTSWWAITLMGVIVAGAAAGTVVAIGASGDTEYRFSP